MANQEHLDILKQGVEVWNQWREEHTEIRPDLTRAYLRGADLIGVDLIGANLGGRTDYDGDNPFLVDLQFTDLSDAKLRGSKLSNSDLSDSKLNNSDLFSSDLRGANLRGAILRGADLRRTDLHEADLREADLRGAALFEANLGDAKLSLANLGMSGLGKTIFGNTDLSMVKELETVEHLGPSIIGIDTIILSQGKIPDIFLRKAGVPVSIIEAIPSLVGSLKPIDFYSCFISYSSKDQNFAERLYADLQSKGVRCWFAPEDMKIGDKFWHRIDESIRLYDKLLVVLSQHSVESEWVEREVMAALEKERQQKRLVLFPITLDEAFKNTTAPWAADIRRSRHTGNFIHWKRHDDYQKGLERLLRDLKASTQ